MKRPFVFFLIACTFLSTYSLCQLSKTDSLLTLLKSDKEDTSKVNHLNLLTRECELTGNFDDGLKYSREAMELGDELNFKTGIAKARNNIGSICMHRGNYAQALENYFAALKIKEELGDKSEIGKTINNIGTVYWNQGDYPKTLEYYFKALKIFEDAEDKNKITVILSNIGLVYKDQGNYPQALEYYFRALKLDEELGREYGIAANFSNIGTVYHDQGDNPKALIYFFKALKINKKAGNKSGIATNLGNIGIVFYEQKDYLKALENHFAALKLKEEIGDKQGTALVCNNIGEVYLKQNKIAEAKKQSLRSLHIAKEIGSKEDTRQAYQTLSLCDSAAGDFKGAYEYHKLYSETKDSLLNEESSRQITEMQTKYETEKKEQQITLLNKDKELQDAQLNRQQIIIWSVAGGLLVVLVLSIFIFRERRKSEKLLLNILPVETARELKARGKASPRHYESVTVMFTDFKGFTSIAEKLSAEELVAELDFLFKKFDEIISKYNIEKIKTIGDAYMCASGLPTPNANHAENIVRAAIEIQDWMQNGYRLSVNGNRSNTGHRSPGTDYWHLRIGIHTGPVTAGVVGDKKFAYDIWGDTVNTASRMESSGEAGKVNISGVTYELIKDQLQTPNSRLQTIYRGKIPAKNKGEIEMYFIEPQKR